MSRLHWVHALLRTDLTHEAATGNPAAYAQLQAGHSQASITERYIHAWWQPVANRLDPEAPKTSQNRCMVRRGLRFESVRGRRT
jgi:hypothetical protein